MVAPVAGPLSCSRPLLSQVDLGLGVDSGPGRCRAAPSVPARHTAPQRWAGALCAAVGRGGAHGGPRGHANREGLENACQLVVLPVVRARNIPHISHIAAVGVSKILTFWVYKGMEIRS